MPKKNALRRFFAFRRDEKPRFFFLTDGKTAAGLMPSDPFRQRKKGGEKNLSSFLFFYRQTIAFGGGV